jgi:glycosyltransferase involved in cell wall biosynthesis
MPKKNGVRKIIKKLAKIRRDRKRATYIDRITPHFDRYTYRQVVLRRASENPDAKKILIGYTNMSDEGGMANQFMVWIKQLLMMDYDITIFFTMQDDIESKKMDELSGLFTAIVPFSDDMTEENSIPITWKEQRTISYAMNYGFSKRIEEKAVRETAHKFAIKYFNDCHFDDMIDFVGSHALHMCVLLEISADKRYIWLHTDYGRTWEHNNRDMDEAIRPDTKVFGQLFRHYDKIVSVGRALSNINKKYFATKQTKKKFTYATNFLDIEKLKLSSLTEPGMNGMVMIKEEIQPNGVKNAMYLPEKKRVRFCYVGRIHPEKNVANIVNACGIVKKQGYDFEVVIAGKGDPYARVNYEKYVLDRIDVNEVSENVIMTGFLQSPVDLLKVSDCLLLVSVYEGFPLSALEARAVGIPIIFSHFATRFDVMVPNGQIVVMADAEYIAEGMIEFIKHKDELKYEWDPYAHNRMALEELKKLLREV